MPRKLRKSSVGTPSAILFSPISHTGVFQQPQAFALIDLSKAHFKFLNFSPSRVPSLVIRPPVEREAKSPGGKQFISSLLSI